MRETRAYVKVSRKHNEAGIRHTVVFDENEVRIEAPLDEFLTALANVVNHDVILAFTPKQLAKKLLANVDAVITDMKNSTV